MPPVQPTMHCPPSDSSILEWLLRSNTADDGPWTKPAMEPQLFPNTTMPYFEVADEPFHGVEAALTPALVHPAPSSSTTTTTTTTTTTSSDVRTSEMMAPSLPFGDI
ncbi:unnamed protein product [Phytophthora lilii]|uniref:Unnamed protein product n=1 Tax=Phytophthora lilii TaxID=2077276 RepID=A0A9W6THZ5_9STRA|nr:unnamed protein product [Phytophthora lilii]